MQKITVFLTILLVALLSACDTLLPPVTPKAPMGHFTAEPVKFNPLPEADEGLVFVGVNVNGESAIFGITFDDGQILKAKIALSVESTLMGAEEVDDNGNLVLGRTQNGTFQLFNEKGTTVFEGDWTSEEQITHHTANFSSPDTEIDANLSGKGKGVYSGYILSASARISSSQDKEPQISLEGNINKG